MLSMNLVVLFAVAAVVALSSSAVVDPKASSNVKENLIDDKAVDVNDTYVPDLSDDDDDTDDDTDAAIDGIPIKSLTENELKDLLDEEDNIIVAQLDIEGARKVIADRNKETQNDIINPKSQGRQRRWIALAGRAFLSAGRALFRGASRAPKPTVSGNRITQSYARPGNYNDAVRDFNRFRPENLRNFNKNGISGQTGTVGPHRFTVRDGSKQGSPTLEIRSPKPNGEYVRKFRYDK